MFVFAQWWAFEDAYCPRHKTLNEDNTYSLHLTIANILFAVRASSQFCFSKLKFSFNTGSFNFYSQTVRLIKCLTKFKKTATKVQAVNCYFIYENYLIVVTRPEKSLHILVKSPDSNLHFLVSPEIALHLLTG
jgi:hypothetical protein